MHSPTATHSPRFSHLTIQSQPQPMVKGLSGTIKLWLARSRQRRQLAQLSNELLKDIGVERNAALQESRKWFWQE